MKIELYILTVILMMANFSYAGINDFNDIIEENSQTQKKLTKELQSQLKTDKLGKINKPNFKKVGEEVLGPKTVENIAVQSTLPIKRKKIKVIDLEKKEFNRLSQEIKEIKE